jgi:ribonuclease HI
LVQRTCYRAALRLATLPTSHPLFKHVKWCAGHYVKRHRAPLHEILHLLEIRPGAIETIMPTRQSSKWEPLVGTHIAEDRETAIAEAARDPADIQVYTDGSCVGGGVGAAAVLYRGGQRQRVLWKHLGPAELHTVYEAETVGLGLAVELLRTERFLQPASVGIDNQAVLRASQFTRSVAGHYLMDGVHHQIARLHKRCGDLEITLRWVPGHEDITGNEDADREAKRAAKGSSSTASHLPVFCRGVLPASKSALRQFQAQRNRDAAAALFMKSPRFRLLHNIDSSAPSPRYQRLIQQLPRRQASLLTQLRTGHVPLNKYLHRIQRAESPICPACRTHDETVQHFLLMCPAYSRQRYFLNRDLSRGSRSLAILLSHPKAFPYLFRYIAHTQRFDGIYNNLQNTD